jgi:hypothetical protein
MAPKTILVVVSTLRRCGVVNVVHGVISNCDPRQYRCIVATLSAEPTDSRIEDLRSIGVHVEAINPSRLGSVVS